MKRGVLLSAMCVLLMAGTAQADGWRQVRLKATETSGRWVSPPVSPESVKVRLYRDGHRLREWAHANGCSATAWDRRAAVIVDFCHYRQRFVVRYRGGPITVVWR